MKKTTYFGIICTLASVGIIVAGNNANAVDRENGLRSSYAHLATVAIPCIQPGLRFSCSNKSPSEPLEVVDVRCIVGAGENPEVQALIDFLGEVAPETTEVESVFCPDEPAPVFCTARVNPRENARCALTSPTGGLNAELK